MTKFAFPQPANDTNALQRPVKSYVGAVKNQQFSRLINDDTEMGDHDYWRKIARDEGHVTITGKHNPYSAARNHSIGGKTTVVIKSDGRKSMFRNGDYVLRESLKD